MRTAPPAIRVRRRGRRFVPVIRRGSAVSSVEVCLLRSKVSQCTSKGCGRNRPPALSAARRRANKADSCYTPPMARKGQENSSDARTEELQANQSTESPNPQKANFLQILDRKIFKQRHWRRVHMVCYVSSVILSVLGSTGALLFAAMNSPRAAAAFAALTTISIGLQNGLLLREKWKFHLETLTALETVKMELIFDKCDVEQALERYESIRRGYASEFPIEATSK